MTVRNLADNVWGRRASVPSLGLTSAADIETRLAHLGLCGYLHATGDGAFGQERRSLGRQLPLRGKEHRGCFQAGDTDLQVVNARENKRKATSFKTLEREIAWRRYGDPGGERGGGTRRVLDGFDF